MAQDTRVIDVEVVVRRGAPTRSAHAALAPWVRRPLGLIGGGIIALLVLLAVVAPLIAPYDGREYAGAPLQSPSREHLLGTNNLGQDVFSRTLLGAQISVAVGLVTTLLAVGLGTLLGVVGGYAGGWTDMLIQRALEVLASFPGIFLALIVIAALGRPSSSGSNVFVIAWELRSIEIAIALAFVFGSTRIIRSAVLTERNMVYVTAAQALGASSNRILWRHILPNVFPYVIVNFSVIIGIVILIEAALSFLGYGAPIGTPSWGVDLSNLNRQYFLIAPWLIVGPGVALSLTVLGFNFFGDALRDIMDPRLRGSR